MIGEDVSTSFGVVAVEHATAISGLNDSQITGAHGVPGLVEAGSIDVQVAAVITNLSDNVLTYEPTQFELIDNTGASVADLEGSASCRVSCSRSRRSTC